MSSDELRLEWTDEAGRRRRLRLTKRAPGGWERRVEELSAGEWRPVGDGIVADLAVTVGADVLADDVLEFDSADGGSVRGYREVHRR